jgi:hypothetical protein
MTYKCYLTCVCGVYWAWISPITALFSVSKTYTGLFMGCTSAMSSFGANCSFPSRTLKLKQIDHDSVRLQMHMPSEFIQSLTSIPAMEAMLIEGALHSPEDYYSSSHPVLLVDHPFCV